MVREIKEEEFDNIIKEGKVLIDCFATWCGPCKMLSPIIDTLSEEVKDCKFYKLDVDKAKTIPMDYGIMSIPTLLIFENGQLNNTLVGFRTKEELLEYLK